MWTSMDWNVVLVAPLLVLLMCLVSFLLGGAATAKVAEGAEGSVSVPDKAEKEQTVPVRGVKIAKTGSDMAGFAGSAPHLQANWDAEDDSVVSVAPRVVAAADREEEAAKAAQAKAHASLAILANSGMFGGQGLKPLKQLKPVAETPERQLPLPLAASTSSDVAAKSADVNAPVVERDVNALLAAAADDAEGVDPAMEEWDEAPYESNPTATQAVA